MAESHYHQHQATVATASASDSDADVPGLSVRRKRASRILLCCDMVKCIYVSARTRWPGVGASPLHLGNLLQPTAAYSDDSGEAEPLTFGSSSEEEELELVDSEVDHAEHHHAATARQRARERAVACIAANYRCDQATAGCSPGRGRPAAATPCSPCVTLPCRAARAARADTNARLFGKC